MQIKVWNLEDAPFPREGLNHLLPSENCPITMWLRREAAKLARLSQFDVPEDEKGLRAFQRGLRRKLWKLLGVQYDGTLPLEVEEVGKISRKGYSIRKVLYQGRKGIWVPALLYIPEGKGPFPAVVNMHGHDLNGVYAERVQRLSMNLAENGYVVLAPFAFGCFERAKEYLTNEYHGGFLGGAVLNLGETLMGAQIVENMRGVDLLRSLPYVKKDKIGACGASGGGNQTMWLAAMDERIAAAMPVVSVGSFESYVTGVNCICELLPYGLMVTEEAGVLALIAPRPLRLGNALYDVNPTFAVGEMLKTYHQVEKLYWKLGVSDRIAYTVADRVHGMLDHQRESILGWFACHLKGEGAGNPIPERDESVLSVKELAFFKNAKARPSKVRTIDEHCRICGAALHRPSRYEAEKKRRELVELLRLQPLEHLKLHEFKAVNGIRRMALEAGEHLIPVLVADGKGNGRCKLLLYPRGKEEVTEEMLRAAQADGSTVVMADLFGTGETGQPNYVLGEHHQLFRQLLWIGRTLPGEWVYDILALVRMAERHLGCKVIAVEGHREAGVCAVFAGAVAKGGFSVVAVDAPASYVYCDDSLKGYDGRPFERYPEDRYFSAMLPIPGFLQWGDVSMAAKLCGKVKFVSPRKYDGTPCKSM